MSASTTPADALQEAIAASGYFPALIADAVAEGVGGEPIESYCLHLEPTFTHDEIHRHLTVLALTPTRLVLVHTDEAPQPADQAGAPGPQPGRAADHQAGQQAILSIESVNLAAVNAVGLTKVVARPASWRPGGGGVTEAWLNVGWGTLRRLELEPAGCEDPQCTADHGFTGTLAAEDLTLRASVAADGEEQIERLVSFARALQQATGTGSTGSVRIGR